LYAYNALRLRLDCIQQLLDRGGPGQ